MEQPDLLRFAIDALEQQGITYLLVGSLASGVYGEPRMTRDIDIVIDIDDQQVEKLCAAFAPGEFYVSLPAAREAVARRRQFNVIHPATGNKIDFMVSRRDPWGKAQVQRRQQEQVLPGCMGYVAGPEDIIISKMQYYQEGQSEKHLRDIAAMLQVSRDRIDMDYIVHWAREMKLMDVWNAVLARLKPRYY